MSVDYSAQDFQQSRAAIDAASRSGNNTVISHGDNVRVRQIGNQTIISEHRDPYSFYWQLDELRKKEEEAPRRLPPTDYIIDEEEIQPQETAILSPDSHDSGINFESQYSKPKKVEEVQKLPAGWEKHEDPSGFSYYWHVDSGTIQREKPVSTLHCLSHYALLLTLLSYFANDYFPSAYPTSSTISSGASAHI